jgi:hypothetical protein
MSQTHYERCKHFVTAVENISENEMEEIFKMIHSHGCTYTRNNNGLFINLTWISEELLSELEQYVKFCKRSQTELKKYESLCHVLNNKLREDQTKDVILNLDIKIDENTFPNIQEIDNDEIIDNIGKNIPVEEELEAELEEKVGSKISSSMKFALLKKRYAKIGLFQTNTIENDLKLEDYIY